MALFRGLSAFPITPADTFGRVDTDALQILLARLDAAKPDSIGLLGSTGIYAYLTRAERKRAIAAAAECLGGRIPIMAGIGALRTDDAQDLARDAQSAGANALLLAPMSYTPLTDEEVFQHFAAVAASTDLPLCIYNNPTTTHFAFNQALVARLAALPRITAIKHPAPTPADAAAHIHAARNGLPAEFAVGYSTDWHAADAILAGGAAWYSVVAGLLPRPALALMHAAQTCAEETCAAQTGAEASGAEGEARRLDAAFQPLWHLFKQHGSLRVIYAAANLLGLTGAQPPLPILPLPASVRDRIARALEELPA